MAQYLVTRGTTLHGKALNEGDVVELQDDQAAMLRKDIVPFAPPPAKEEESAPKTIKKKS